jgi:hypothetical protein
MRAFVFCLAVLAFRTAAIAEPVRLVVANATVVDVVEVGPYGPSGGLSISFTGASADAFARFTAANVDEAVELRLNGTVMFAFVVTEEITNGRVRMLGIPPDRALGLARQLTGGDKVVEIEVFTPPS